MSLIKKNSDKSLFPSVENLWNNFFSDDFFQKGFNLGTSLPAVNTKETDKEYCLEFAVPGMKKEDINIDIDNDVITISSENKEEKEEKDGEKITRKEFSYSSFQRSFNIPDDVKKEEISAKYKDGILKLELPKSTDKKVENKKRIEIK